MISKTDKDLLLEALQKLDSPYVMVGASWLNAQLGNWYYHDWNAEIDYYLSELPFLIETTPLGDYRMVKLKEEYR